MQGRVTQPLSRVGGRRPGVQAVTDQLTIENVSAPDSVVPGETVTITARISCQTTPFTDCEAAARFIFGDQEQRVPTSGVVNIPENGEDTFSATFQMPQSTTTLVIEAIERGAVGGFNVEDTAELTIEAVTQQEKTQQKLLSFAPFVVGGGAIGAGAAQFTDRPVVGGAAVGAGVGAGAKLATDGLGGAGGGGLGNLIPSFPTVPVLAVAALLTAGALFFVATPTGRALNVASSLPDLPTSR